MRLCVLVAGIKSQPEVSNCLHNLSHGCRCASWQTFWQLYYFTTFYFFLLSWLVALADMAALKAKISLYRAGEEKPIERYKTRLKSRKRINYFRRPKKILSSFLGSTSKLKSSVWGHLTWKYTAWQKSMAKRRITPYQHSSNPRVNCRFQAGGEVRERLGWQWQWCRYWVRRTGYWWANDDKQGQEDKSRSADMAALKAKSKSLSRWRREAYRKV